MNHQNPAIVIDNGSSLCKAGFAGDYALRCCFPAVVGIYKMPVLLVGVDSQDTFIGQQALQMRGILKLNFPIENGIVNNWDEMERIWNHTFYEELRISPEDQPCLLTEAPLNPKANREKITSIMFETFNVPSFHLQNQAILSLCQSGRTTGMVVDAGDSVTHFVPIFNGLTLHHAIQKSDIAGKACTDWLRKIIEEELGTNFKTSSEKEIVQYIKEKVAYVAFDYDEELLKFKQSTIDYTPYELPDGNIITIQDQRFRCPELLFKPNLMELKAPGMHEFAFTSIMKCDIDVRRDLLNNIVISGGSSMLPGLAERLSKELIALVPTPMKIKVIAPPERQISAWIGGSILSSLSTFQSQWITRADYEENGATIIHRTCFQQ